MSNDVRLAEIRERWEGNETVDQCEDWWYSAVRHVQRNMDGMCEHETWGSSTNISDEDFVATHPDRYDGTRHAHAGADIAYLLKLVEVTIECDCEFGEHSSKSHSHDRALRLAAISNQQKNTP